MVMSGQNFSFFCSPTTQKLAMNKFHTTCTNVQTMDGSLFSTDFGYHIISTCACYFHLSVSMISCDLHQVKALSGLKFLKDFPLVVMTTSFPDNKNTCIKHESRDTLNNNVTIFYAIATGKEMASRC